MDGSTGDLASLVIDGLLQPEPDADPMREPPIVRAAIEMHGRKLGGG